MAIDGGEGNMKKEQLTSQLNDLDLQIYRLELQRTEILSQLHTLDEDEKSAQKTGLFGGKCESCLVDLATEAHRTLCPERPKADFIPYVGVVYLHDGKAVKCVSVDSPTRTALIQWMNGGNEQGRVRWENLVSAFR